MASKTGEIVTETSMISPSLRRRLVSKDFDPFALGDAPENARFFFLQSRGQQKRDGPPRISASL